MALHGVEESEIITLSNMKFLYEQVRKADRILNY
jgi:hypothetical protein